MQEEKAHKRKGLIGTIVFHLCLLILFLFTGFTEPDPLPKEEGMPLQIRLGFDDAGSGETFDNRTTAQTTPQVTETSTQSATEYLTQEAASLAQVIKSTKKVEDPKPTAEELEAQRKAAEAKRQQEHLKSLFAKTKNNEKSGQGTGGGSDNQAGTQGREFGGRFGGKTGGALPGGGNYVLGGRRLAKTPKIFDDSQDEGKVVVRIYVDRSGNVIKAEPGIKGSTTNSATLFEKAKRAALKTKFDAHPDAPIQQVGSMSFVFLIGH